MSQPDLLSQPIKEGLAKRLRVTVWIVSAVVLLLVALMRSSYKIPVSREVEKWIWHLPETMAALNVLVAALLLGGLWAIIRKNHRVHQWCMMAALVLSGLFLLCYVAYHFTMFETKFGDVDGNRVLDDEEKAQWGNIRIVYLVILFSHIAAAAISFPMILMTFVHAWTRDFAKHRKLARKTFPLWFYVAITGPLCYWMLHVMSKGPPVESVVVP
jgi:putative membrane protein